MQHWIFVMTGTVYDFNKRIDGGKWPIYTLTRRRKDLKPGDKIVFYLAGLHNMKLLGTAKISSKLHVDKVHDFTVDISDVAIWKKPKPMKELVSSLGFIKNKSNWGLSIQGGVVSLPPQDYETIISA